MVGGGGGLESDYSVCPRPFLRPVQDWEWDRDGTGMGQGRHRDGTETGQGRDWDGGTGRDGELDNIQEINYSHIVEVIDKDVTTNISTLTNKITR